MDALVAGRRPRGGEGLVEIVERSEGRGAEDSEFERAGGALESCPRAAEARRGMGDQRLDVERPQVDRGLEDEAGEGAGLALAERASGGILDLHAPARELRRYAPGDRRIGRDEGRGLARRLENLAHGDRERERLLGFVFGDDDRHAVEGGGDGGGRKRRFAPAPEVRRVRRAQRFAEERRARGERSRRSAERPHVLAR